MIHTGFSEINEDRLAYTGTDPWYLEVVLTGKCNFACKYCNRFKSELDIERFTEWLDSVPQLHHIQMTGGEPTIHRNFERIVYLCRSHTKVLGLSTNGSWDVARYLALPIDMFSVSLDDYNHAILEQRGYRNPAVIEEHIRLLASQRYVNIGLVIDELNVDRIEDIIDYILSLGVSDIKLSVSSQSPDIMPKFTKNYAKYPILAYRVQNFKDGRPMRGYPTVQCHIMQNDVTIVGDKHYPCLVYFREHGDAIGMVSARMLTERRLWHSEHNCQSDPICSKFCFDFKCAFNTEFERRHHTLHMS